jgi:hypothetical protein
VDSEAVLSDEQLKGYKKVVVHEQLEQVLKQFQK